MLTFSISYYVQSPKLVSPTSLSYNKKIRLASHLISIALIHDWAEEGKSLPSNSAPHYFLFLMIGPGGS